MTRILFGIRESQYISRFCKGMDLLIGQTSLYQQVVYACEAAFITIFCTLKDQSNWRE